MLTLLQHGHCTFVIILFRPFAGLIRALFSKSFLLHVQDRSTRRICNFYCLVTSRSHSLQGQQLSAPQISKCTDSQSRSPCSSHRSQITARNVTRIRLSPHSILNVSRCFLCHAAVTAFTPKSAILCFPVLFVSLCESRQSANVLVTIAQNNVSV